MKLEPDKIEVLKVVAHPARIEILRELRDGVKCVSDFEDSLDLSQPNVSQHLSLLRRVGAVDCYMDGRLRCYFLKDSFVLDLLHILDDKHKRKELPAPLCCPSGAKGRR